MHTETYCATLQDLDPVAAIRAIHEAYLQLKAMTANCDVAPYDAGPALEALKECLAQAGHPAGGAGSDMRAPTLSADALRAAADLGLVAGGSR